MLILGIETSCDETSIAIVEDGKYIKSHTVYSQIKEHEAFMGVVPELASRIHFDIIFPMIEKTLIDLNLTWNEIDAIAVTKEPGLLGSLLLGFTVAKTLAYILKKPLIPVNHLWAHLYAPFLESTMPPFPYGGLIASGGHTLLAIISNYDKVDIIGSTMDDSIGECYDKVAKMLSLGYPGGPLVDKSAQKFKEKATYNLPDVQFHHTDDRYTFSYSGLKTAVRRIVEKEGEQVRVEELCYVFQLKAIDQLMSRIKNAIEYYQLNHFVIAGGVAANSELRERVKDLKGCNIYIPSPLLCTDNAAMVAGIAYHLKPLSPLEYRDLDVRDKVLTFQDKQNLRSKNK